MTFSFSTFCINKVDESKLSFNVNNYSINPMPTQPVELLELKDSNNNYLFDSNNNKLFVRR